LAKSDIMVVDDNPSNLKLLEDMLLQQGHEVRSFPLGRLALAAAAKRPPDLILLDINMPEMNGYEVCERLKASPELSAVPVIFLSALDDTEDKIRAFQSGGVDYISKPFHFEEVNARVETHLGLHNLQQALRLQNEHLEGAVRARTRELAEANTRLTILDHSKSEFLNLISHEFRTPLNGLLSVGEIVLDEMIPTNENRELREIFDKSRERILSILDDALLITQIDVRGDQFRSAPVSLQAVLTQAVQETAQFAAQRYVKLDLPPESADLVVGDEKLLVRAVHALLETAVKFSTEGEAVRITRQVTADSLNLIIETRGETIPIPVLTKFFEVFSIGEASTPGRDLGLGPSVAFSILSLFGASVTVANQDPSGIRLTIALADVKQAKA
jgi:two-component system sensor histidine kinase/response regulator